MSDERDPQAHRIMELSRELDALRATNGNDVAVEDVRQILAALGLGTHARSYSAHEVVQREVLPALLALRATVERVEALTDLHAECGQFVAVWDLRLALDGDR